MTFSCVLNGLPGVAIIDAIVLGALIDSSVRERIFAGELEAFRISCGPPVDHPRRIIKVDGKPQIHCLRRGRTVSADTTPIGDLLSVDQRHFLGRARRAPA